jgi:hypothetical protein
MQTQTRSPDAWLDQFADICQRSTESIEKNSANHVAGSVEKIWHPRNSE